MRRLAVEGIHHTVFSSIDGSFPAVEGGYISNDSELSRYGSSLADWINGRGSALAAYRESSAELDRARLFLVNLLPRGVWFRVLFDGSYYCVGWHYADGDRVVEVFPIGDWDQASNLDDWSM